MDSSWTRPLTVRSSLRGLPWARAANPCQPSSAAPPAVGARLGDRGTGRCGRRGRVGGVRARHGSRSSLRRGRRPRRAGRPGPRRPGLSERDPVTVPGRPARPGQAVVRRRQGQGHLGVRGQHGTGVQRAGRHAGLPDPGRRAGRQRRRRLCRVRYLRLVRTRPADLRRDGVGDGHPELSPAPGRGDLPARRAFEPSASATTPLGSTAAPGSGAPSETRSPASRRSSTWSPVAFPHWASASAASTTHWLSKNLSSRWLGIPRGPVTM